MKKSVELVFIMDRSGSMYSLEQDCVGGFNATLAKQKEQEGTVYVTTYLFNHESQIVHDRLKIEDVKTMRNQDYMVGGSTALLDCLGDAMSHIEMIHKYIRSEDQVDQVLFVIMTDGQENASHKYSYHKIKKMIQEKTKKGWEFIYLAANIDAASNANMLGIDESNCSNYHHDKQGVENFFGSINDAISQCRKEGKLNASWKNKVANDYKLRKGKN